MAIDIIKSKTDNLIKNGSIVVSTKVTGPTVKDALNAYVLNTPILADIETKYETRFDDPSYYYGVGNSTVIGG